MFKSVFSSSRDLLSPHTALEVASIHLENARQAKNPELALTLCNEAEAALSRIKRAAKKALISPPFSVEDQTLRVGIATAYFEHGKLVESLGYRTKAQASHKKAQKWGWLAQEPGQTSVSSEKGTSLPTTEPSAAQLLATLTPLPTQDGPGHASAS
ncbi:hypothetical protein EDD21DRAFT_408766 [Dissophora ornata]|nr:hypothetical protein EDD21DRAFT_408766 [Dissophora ornata]